jgi:FMN-dependent NADH-azoreductase
MGREEAHHLIKKYATSHPTDKFMEALLSDPGIPITNAELSEIVSKPKHFSGNAVQQCRVVQKKVNEVLKLRNVSFIDMDLR